MLDINTFFNQQTPEDIPGVCEYRPSRAEYLPLQQYLESQGAKFVLDTENGESDEAIIEVLRLGMAHWNWEVIHTLEIGGMEYSVAHCKTLNIWLVDLWQDSAEEISNTWFMG